MERGNRILRWIDEGLGPLLLWILAPFQRLWRSRRKTNQIRRIAVIKAAALGDTILLSAILSDLRQAFPNTQILLFVGSSNVGLAKSLPGIDQVIQLPMKNPFRAISLLRAQPIDLLFDTDSWPRISALWSAISNTAWTIGFRTAGQHRHFCYDLSVTHSNTQHELENYRDLLRAMEIPTVNQPMNPVNFVGVHLSGEWGHRFEQFRCDQVNRQLVAFHLWPGGNRSELKEWPLVYWRKLAQQIIMVEGWSVILTGGPDDQQKNQKFISSLEPALADRILDFSGAPLMVSLAMIQNCQAVVSVNTGILHLTAAMDKPVLGLHGPTNPLRWGPVGDCCVSVVSRHPHAACLNLGSEYPDDASEIMQELSYEVVLKGWHELLRKNSLG